VQQRVQGVDNVFGPVDGLEQGEVAEVFDPGSAVVVEFVREQAGQGSELGFGQVEERFGLLVARIAESDALGAVDLPEACFIFWTPRGCPVPKTR